MHALINQPGYLAALGHRLSGLALAIFIPFHFLLLGRAFDGAEAVNRYLVYTDTVPVKIAEWGLVTMLALHFFFGLRVLLLEFTPWPKRINRLAAWVLPCTLASLLIGGVFLLQIYSPGSK